MESKKLAVAGIAGAIGFILTFIEFPIFPVVGFLKYDPSDTMIILVTLLYGWLPGLLTTIVKDLLFLLKAGNGGPLGIFMNFMGGFTFISVYVLLSKIDNNKIGNKNSGFIKWINYIISSFAVSLVMLGMNYFLAIPVYTNSTFNDFSEKFLKLSPVYLIGLIVLFNLIKFIVDSIIADLIHKRAKDVI